MPDFRKPWERSEFHSDRPPRGGFKKPWEKREGGDRPPRREGGFRKPWEDRGEGGEGRPPRREGGFRKPWEARPEEESPEGRAPSRPTRMTDRPDHSGDADANPDAPTYYG